MKPKYPRGDTAELARKAGGHGKRANRHRKNPCPHRPAQIDSGDLFGEFFKRPGKGRHNRWRWRIRWPEVRFDADGFPLIVRTYAVEVEYSANEVDWFLLDRIQVPAKDDDDDNDKVQKIIKGIRARLAYRYRVRAIGVNCKAEWSDYFTDTLSQGPPAPSNVSIHRRPHGIFVNWDEEVDDTDDDDEGEIFHDDVDHAVAQLFLGTEPYTFPTWVAFTGEESDDKLSATSHGLANGDIVMVRGASLPAGLKVGRRYYVVSSATNDFKVSLTSGGSAVNLTADGSGYFMRDLYHWKRHLKKTQVRFHVDASDIDEDQKFFARVLNVDDDRDRSAFIPATLGGNSDPDADPDGRLPKMIRRVITFNVPGPLVVGTYKPPNRFDDDYIIRRYTGAADTAGTGGAAIIDLQVRPVGGAYASVFEDDTGDMLSLPAGDDDGSTKLIHNRAVERGDHFKVKVVSLGSTPPEDLTLQIIADRVG